MTIRVIDLETTGVDPAEHSIIEIASVDLLQGGRIGNRQSHLVRPGRDIPPESSAVHHLIEEDFKDAQPLADVIDKYAGADAYVAHHCQFERSFLDQHFGDKPWICTHKVALRVLPDAPGHSNQTLRYYLGLVTPFGVPRNEIEPHRALSDCIVTACILHWLMQKASWSDMLKWTAEPPLYTKFSFGKHKGKRYDEIARDAPDYLEWIIAKSDLDADTKWNAAYWLKQPRAAEPAKIEDHPAVAAVLDAFPGAIVIDPDKTG